MDPAMEFIFHEKQQGSLCAQHCLNSLLQGAYFTPVELSAIARRMDELERHRMAECGEESEEYQRFLRQPSTNMDDSGFFSIQVISSALQVWNLELVQYDGLEMLTAPNVSAFICHYNSHWLTIRKICGKWYNLNSLLPRPVRLSNSYLALYLSQLQLENYAIFAVVGQLPVCVADEMLSSNPTAIAVAERNVRNRDYSTDQQRIDPQSEDEQLQQAIQMSLQF